MRYAETAAEAWRPPAGLKGHARAFARRQILQVARLRRSPSPDNYVRCLYSHAVFPEHRGQFRDIMRKLKSNADFIDTDTLIEIIKSGQPIKGRYHHLSFDDGFANVFEVGGAALASEGIPYSVFVATDLIDADWETLDRYNRERLKYGAPVRTMSWDQVRACASAGGEIGCHTRTHARLSQISSNANLLHGEIVGAKMRIEAETGRPCRSFAWPFGMAKDIDGTALSKIGEAGFEITFSATRGRIVPGATSLMSVPRHQLEFHWPVWENLLWAGGYRD